MQEHMPADREQLFQVHPYKILMYLSMGSMSALFFGVTFAYLYQIINHDIATIIPPYIFVFNTVLLLLSSWLIVRANRAYLADDTEAYTRSLIYTLVVTVLFMVAQIAAWMYMSREGMLASDNPSTGYLYVISGLHFLHVIGGLPFLVLFIRTARKRMKEPVSVMVYFSDPEKRLKLRLLTMYWHFLDGLWIYLVVFFLLMKVIRIFLG